MSSFLGSCHCGVVRFRVEVQPTHLVRCNCSICQMKGALLFPVGEVDRVHVLEGESELTPYRFHSQKAEHLFCRHCGIHPFHRPRIDPTRWSVNVNCLDDGIPNLPVQDFDGRNWEEAARAEGWAG